MSIASTFPGTSTPPDGEKTPTAEEEKKFQEQSEKTMQAEADKLRARAVAGDDFVKLQEQAFEACRNQDRRSQYSDGKGAAQRAASRIKPRLWN